MINGIFLMITTVVISIFNVFYMSAFGNDIKRIFLEIPLNVIENSVAVNVSNESNIVYYFIPTLFQTNVTNYLSQSLENRLDSYKISFTFFNYKNNGIIDFNYDNKPLHAQVHFNAKYYLNYEIDEHLIFDAKRI